MEPALDERGDRHALTSIDSKVSPQWSPLSTSGATTSTNRGGPIFEAAMEPALDERGDDNNHIKLYATGKGPQWSPLSTSGATSVMRQWA